MFGWHHRLNGHEFEQAPGDSEGQGSLACSSLWDCKELDRTWLLNHINGLGGFGVKLGKHEYSGSVLFDKIKLYVCIMLNNSEDMSILIKST